MSKHPLQIALEDAELPCRSYTGRGMQHECLAVTTNMQAGDLIASVLDHISDPVSALSDIAEALRSMHSDSMGMRAIFYFPTVDYCEEAKDSDSDDLDPADPIHPLYPA